MKSFFLLISFLSFCLGSRSLFAKNTEDNTPLDSVTQNRPMLFNYYVVKDIQIEGNQITHPSIILRELTFKAGDQIPLNIADQILERSRQNIFNTSLFNFVEIAKEIENGNEIRIKIKVFERWYTWPSPVFELADRNFNEWWSRGRSFSRTNYGMYLVQENFRGRDETLTIGVRAGFSEKYSLSYEIPYLSKRKKGGLILGFSFGRNHEIPYAVDEANHLLFYKNPDKYILESVASSLRYTYRAGIYNTNIASLEFNQESVADTVTHLNTDFYVKGMTRNRYISLGYYFAHDQRDFKNYPLVGNFFDIGFRQSGLGIEKNQIQFLSLYGSVKRFWQLNQNWFYAAGLSGRFVKASTLPYLYQSALGYGTDYVRGYEYQVFKGYHFMLLKTNLKYRLISERVYKLGWPKLEKFNTIPYALYMNFIFDAGYLMQRPSDRLQFKNILPGYGIGLDYVTYYSMVLRMEYTFNKFGKSDLYLHFVIPI